MYLRRLIAFPFLGLCVFFCTLGPAQVESEQKISDTEGSFSGSLGDNDQFGSSLAWIGDLSGSGDAAVAVGANADDDGEDNAGALWILLLGDTGEVDDEQKISTTQGEFGGTLAADDAFATAVASIGDLDGDGVTDLAVGAPGDDTGGSNRGCVWILYLNDDGTVKDEDQINDFEGKFVADLDNDDGFGSSLAALGDVDGDDVPDLAVGAPGDDDGGTNRGCVYVLFLNDDGSVKQSTKVSDSEGDFPGVDSAEDGLANQDFFGRSVAFIGDLDEDGLGELAIGATGDGSAGFNSGAVWILFLDLDDDTLTVRDSVKLSGGKGGFTNGIEGFDSFGRSIAALGDFNDDGVPDLAVGSEGDDDESADTGAVRLLYLNDDGTVAFHHKISAAQGGFGGELDSSDWYGFSIASVGDLNDAGGTDLIIGAIRDDDGGDDSSADRGALWVTFLSFVDWFARGDADGNGVVFAFLDALYLLEYGFVDGEAPPCFDAADIDDDGNVFPILDAICLLEWAFLSGDAPPSPGPELCGPDPTEDSLDCETPPICP